MPNRSIAILFFTLAVSVWYCFMAVRDDYVINTSSSLPGLVYRREPTDLSRGQTVMFCHRGKWARLQQELDHFNNFQCPTGLNAHIKLTAGVPGDHIKADGQHEILINGTPFRGSAPNPKNDFMTFKFEGVLDQDQYLLLTPNPRSFDSRYYGIIPASQIISGLRKVF